MQSIEYHEDGYEMQMAGVMTSRMSFFCILSKHTVIEGQTHHGLLMATVLPFDLSGLHTPQTCKVIGGG